MSDQINCPISQNIGAKQGINSGFEVLKNCIMNRVSAKRTRNLVDQDFLDSSYKTQFPLSGNVLDFSQNSLKREQSGKANSKFYMVKYRKG